MKVFALLPIYVEDTKRWVWWKSVWLFFGEDDLDEYLHGPPRWYQEFR